MARVTSERRVGAKPVPHNLRSLLTDLQQGAMRQLENFGWSVLFVRRHGLSEPLVVVGDAATFSYGVLQKDGFIDREADIGIRW